VKKKEQEKLLKKKQERDNEQGNNSEPELDKPNKEEEKDFEYYGEEDLYYKEDKISENELKSIKEEVKNWRINLLDLLNEGEDVQKALNRLKPQTQIKSTKQINQRKKQKIEDGENGNENMQKENKEKFEMLMNIISKLTELSFFDVYKDTKQRIYSAYGEEEILIWWYKTINKNTKEETEYGPFKTSEIKQWKKEVILFFI
jgi:hypothetical protein